MIAPTAIDEYINAQHMGQKEKKELEALGRNPFPPALEEIFPDIAGASVQVLPVSDIPADRIVGTKAAGRTTHFPLPFSRFRSRTVSLP